MAKGSFLDDTFEQLAELGVSTAKKSAQQVVQTLSPLQLAKKALGKGDSNESNETNKSNSSNSPESIKKNQDHTPLDFNKLQKKFKDQEKSKLDGMRNRLFQIVKREEEKSLERQKMSEAEKKRNEETQVQEKKHQKKENERQGQQSGLPQGKTRRGIFGSKKKSDEQHAEVKPASGKQ